jgi:hypothetical protein
VLGALTNGIPLAATPLEVEMRATPRVRWPWFVALGVAVVVALAFEFVPAFFKRPDHAVIYTRILLNQHAEAILDWRSKHAGAACPATLEELQVEGFVNVNVPPVDVWGEPLVYRCPVPGGDGFELLSKGRDRIEGTRDDVRP